MPLQSISIGRAPQNAVVGAHLDRRLPKTCWCCTKHADCVGTAAAGWWGSPPLLLLLQSLQHRSDQLRCPVTGEGVLPCYGWRRADPAHPGRCVAALGDPAAFWT